MKKFFSSLGRFTTKLVSLLVVCGFISLACLPMVHAEEGGAGTGDTGDEEQIPDSTTGCHPPVTDTKQPGTETLASLDDTTEGNDDPSTGEGTTTPDDGTVTPPVGGGEDQPGAGDDTGEETSEYNVTLEYSGTEEPDDTLVCKAGKYRFTAKEIEGYAAQEQSVVAEVGADKGNKATFSYEKIVAKGTLTITYHYSDGSKADEVKTEEIEVGKDYEVATPEVDGYTPDKTVVKGTMVEGGVQVTVTYTKNTTEQPTPVTYTITIKYQDTTGAKIADDTTQKCEANKECTIVPKDIDGYITPASLKQTFTEDDAVTFAYEKMPAKATLTIHYEYTDHTKAADDYIGQVEVGKDYEVKSPAIANYTPNLAIVTGKMVEDGAEVTVTYTRNSSDKPTEYTITLQYHDAEGKALRANKTEVRTAGKYSFGAEPIEGYKLPPAQVVEVTADTTVTFVYEKLPTTPDDPTNPDDPTTPDDPTDPKDPPAGSEDDDPTKPGTDDKPTDQKPGSEGPAKLPTAGPSDVMIRDFLILDAEVSAGGIGLWAVSGVIRRIRRR